MKLTTATIRVFSPGVLALLASLGATSASAEITAQDIRMMEVARTSGCLLCHSVLTEVRTAETVQPIGPSWQNVAARYRGKPSATERLRDKILAGSSSSENHWEKISGRAMPSNAKAISEEETDNLVAWILTLPE